MKNAFITYLCNDAFIPGAIALKNSLDNIGSRFPISCMIAEDVTEGGKQELSDAGFELILVDKIIPNRTSGIIDRYKDDSWMMFTKLNIWNQTQYDKLVYIDADCVILESVDELFDFPAISAIKDPSYGGLSGGVLVLEPDAELYKDMLKNINYEGYDNRYSDQSFLDWYTKTKKLYNEIPIQYNVHQKRFHLSPGVKIYHYNGQKPWIQDPSNSCSWRMGDNEIFKLWHYFYNLKKEQ